MPASYVNDNLATLLDYLGADTLVITGFTTDICVRFTAADAFMRDAWFRRTASHRSRRSTTSRRWR